MTQPAPDLVEVDVFPELVREGDYLVDAADTVTGRPDDAHSDATHVAIPTRAGGGYAMIRRGALTRVRRPRTIEQLAAVRDLALALADRVGAQGASVDKAAKRVADTADRVRKAAP